MPSHKTQNLSVVFRFKKLSFLLICLTFLGPSLVGQTGLQVEYYDGMEFERLAAIKTVSHIDQHWNNVPPVPEINPHECSIRWTGKLKPGKSGTFWFSARVDDGIRVWIDHQMIINQWGLNDVGLFKGKAELEANKEYDLKVEYFNGLNEGEVTLLWKIPKSKEELSWTERLFGANNPYKTITPEYYILPDELREVPKVAEDEELKIDTQKPKKQEKKTKPKYKLDSPTPTKEVLNAKRAEMYIPKNVQFVHAKTEILESSHNELDVFARFMLDNPQLNVKIEGHTDAVGDAEKNMELSEKRAFTVARYLVEQGVNGLRIKTEGFGGSRPLKIPKKGEYYPENRRVVFKLSGLDE